MCFYVYFLDSPAFNSGIRVGDIILKINGTCVRTKESIEITNMIYECKLTYVV